MADTKWEQTDYLAKSLMDNPAKWGFFQAVRMLDCLSYSKDAKIKRTGASDTLKDEGIRFKQKPSLGFHEAEIAKYKPADSQQDLPATVYSNFLGLWGANAPLPLVFTEYAFERAKHHDDNSMINFMDIFHHRILALFYRAWSQNQPIITADREDDDFKRYLASMIGAGVFLDKKSSSPVSLNAKVYNAGHLLSYTPNISNISSILSGHFKTKADIKPFMAKSIRIDKKERFYIGKDKKNGSLGKNIIIGKHFNSCMQKFRVILGPMSFGKYKKLLPGTNGYKQLINWVKYYTAGRYNFDIQLIPNKHEIPMVLLSRTARLGHTCWLRSKPSIDINNNVIVGGV